MEGWLPPFGMAAAGGERIGGEAASPMPAAGRSRRKGLWAAGNNNHTAAAWLPPAPLLQSPPRWLRTATQPAPRPQPLPRWLHCALLLSLAPTRSACPVAAAGEPLLDLIADSCLATRDAFDPRSLTHVLWSLARLGYVDETFYAEFVPVVSFWGHKRPAGW